MEISIFRNLSKLNRNSEGNRNNPYLHSYLEAGMVAKSEPVSDRVVHAVAARDNSDPLELPPLYYGIDPDALDACIDGLSEGTIQFEYAGYSIVVHSDATVKVLEKSHAEAITVEAAGDD